jgi:K+-transporting ATPase A subunit
MSDQSDPLGGSVAIAPPPETRPTFVAFLLGVILIMGGLIYLPMLILGPIGERIVG